MSILLTPTLPAELDCMNPHLHNLRAPAYPPPAPPSSGSPLATIDMNTAQASSAPATSRPGPKGPPRRRNALVPLPLLPPVPPNVVIKVSDAGLVKVIPDSVTQPPTKVNKSNQSPKSASRPLQPVPASVAFPATKDKAVETNNTKPDVVMLDAPTDRPIIPLRMRKESVRPRITVPLSKAAPKDEQAQQQSSTTELNPHGKPFMPIPKPSFPVAGHPAIARVVPEIPVFKPMSYARPRVSSPLVPLPSYDPMLIQQSLPTRHMLHPSFCFRPRPRSSKRPGNDLRRVAVHANEQGRKICTMGVQMAVEVWEAEQLFDEIDEEDEMMFTEEPMEMDVDEQQNLEWADIIDVDEMN